MAKSPEEPETGYGYYYEIPAPELVEIDPTLSREGTRSVSTIL
jgi:hypothetical protein